jgi:hypothetical protein
MPGRNRNGELGSPLSITPLRNHPFVVPARLKQKAPGVSEIWFHAGRYKTNIHYGDF